MGFQPAKNMDLSRINQQKKWIQLTWDSPSKVPAGLLPTQHLPTTESPGRYPGHMTLPEEGPHPAQATKSWTWLSRLSVDTSHNIACLPCVATKSVH